MVKLGKVYQVKFGKVKLGKNENTDFRGAIAPPEMYVATPKVGAGCVYCLFLKAMPFFWPHCLFFDFEKKGNFSFFHKGPPLCSVPKFFTKKLHKGIPLYFENFWPIFIQKLQFFGKNVPKNGIFDAKNVKKFMPFFNKIAFYLPFFQRDCLFFWKFLIRTLLYP